MENGKKITELMAASSVSEGDWFLINQPNVDNLITGGKGDTRKISPGQVADYMLQNIHINPYGSTLPPGIILPCAINDEWLPLFRLLKLDGQTIDISSGSPYYMLGQVAYVGDANNNNPNLDGFYKVNSAWQRDISGDKMVLPDAKGMFLRGTGANSRHFAANDTPYDGKEIGSFNPDGLPLITGNVGIVALQTAFYPTGPFSVVIAPNNFQDNISSNIGFSTSGVVFSIGNGNEVKTASLSTFFCISY